MATISQCTQKKTKRIKKISCSRTPRLQKCPHAKGLVVRIHIMTPKKPNSARRRTIKVKLYSKPRVTAKLPGSGYSVQKFHRCLVRGGRANDLPGVSYSIVRNVYEVGPCTHKKKRRSFYGVAKQKNANFYKTRFDRKDILKNFKRDFKELKQQNQNILTTFITSSSSLI